jgi:hypothetical protein
MSNYKASTFIKAGTCIRFLIDVREGSAIGKARPDPGQSAADRINSRGEKINDDSNVLSNMQKIDDLISEAGFANVRTGDRNHLKNILIPKCLQIKNEDNEYGVLTKELAQQISNTAREIRKGMLEAADKVTLYDQPDNSDKWPSEFHTNLLFTPPWWLVLAFTSVIGLSISFTETKIYSDIKEWLSPQEQTKPSTTSEPKEKDKLEKESGSQHGG